MPRGVQGKETEVFSEEFFRTWGYLGVFVGIIATGLGFPMPEEVPVILGGVLVGHPGSGLVWYIMLPVCIVGVVIGDGFLYGIGRLWGPRLVQYGWVKKRLLPPERLERIERNFHEYGIKILLFARLTPGIRAPIFVTAGITRIPLTKFLLADCIYAIPGVSLLFFLGYWFTDRLNEGLVAEGVHRVKSIIILVVIVAVAAYFAYRFLRKPMVTGGPEEIPHLVEQMTSKIIHGKGKEGHPENRQPPHAVPSVEKSKGPNPESSST
jgi:membrane protein DedA with SNARE-associated domain